MKNYICRTCGVQYASAEAPPPGCILCDDERQYVGWDGQQWLTMAEMRTRGYRNEIREHEPRLLGIGTEPRFAIGQRSLLLQSDSGNLLWDPISYIDDETIQRVNGAGGIQAIAASHPHFYGAMVDWSRTFTDAPIYVPEDDQQWVTRPDPMIKLWNGTVQLFPDVTLIQCGGHFPGSAVVHWATGAEGRGALLVGDSITVVQDRRFVSFMWSYPNVIPLSEPDVQHIVEAVAPYPFDRIYGGWWGSIVQDNGSQAVARSAERYINRIRGH